MLFAVIIVDSVYLKILGTHLTSICPSYLFRSNNMSKMWLLFHFSRFGRLTGFRWVSFVKPSGSSYHWSCLKGLTGLGMALLSVSSDLVLLRSSLSPCGFLSSRASPVVLTSHGIVVSG